MDTKQSFNLDADFLGGFTSLFIKLVLIVIAVYVLIMIINFLRDTFIHKDTSPKKENISDVLVILNKLFYFSGFGFIIANVLQVLLSAVSNNSNRIPSMNLRGEWDYLAFGIIIIFIGIGFKVGNKMLEKKKTE